MRLKDWKLCSSNKVEECLNKWAVNSSSSRLEKLILILVRMADPRECCRKWGPRIGYRLRGLCKERIRNISKHRSKMINCRHNLRCYRVKLLTSKRTRLSRIKECLKKKKRSLKRWEKELRSNSLRNKSW